MLLTALDTLTTKCSHYETQPWTHNQNTPTKTALTGYTCKCLSVQTYTCKCKGLDRQTQNFVVNVSKAVFTGDISWKLCGKWMGNLWDETFTFTCIGLDRQTFTCIALDRQTVMIDSLGHIL